MEVDLESQTATVMILSSPHLLAATSTTEDIIAAVEAVGNSAALRSL